MRSTEQAVAAPPTAPNTAKLNKPIAKRAWDPPVLNRLSVVDTTLSPKLDFLADGTGFS